MLPTTYPLYDFEKEILQDGALMPACSFCKNSIKKKPECWQHYDSLRKKPEGYYQCPFGFTTRTFYFLSKLYAITGVIAFPRFNTDNERAKAKEYPEVRISRVEIDKLRHFYAKIDDLRAKEIETSAQVFPQAFHELRKLNGTIIQSAELELKTQPNDRFLKKIKGAAELMRNSFDMLEALSNIEGMKVVPLDATINVYDLTFKMKRIYDDKAMTKGMQIRVNGVRAIVKGSQKSFPIVPAVLIENAIKYGKANSAIDAHIEAKNKKMILTVENQTSYSIDSTQCFSRGTRFAGPSVEGGGFGLFLAQQVVDAHQGTIQCVFDGSTVKMTVEVPLLHVMQGF
jgi:light-regulated signal transduction histidine kinase (bacteriophytochrome)